ncbi:DUF4091 domain-containing protein [Dysgonomonas sp. Marseille-P4361]|uniref:DUF4091 domain-containing protein n=1 Tax=Dysgonomonas sp. Marseille-P4361 TaxID=2161820 RepID=UPI000D5555E5|nr:DUF4091 domain-containing protein [Dysgonomonas sp. Marseille-P4361]
MKKTISKNLLLTCCILCVSFFIIQCTPSRAPKTCDTFKELPDPTNDTLSDWSNVKPGLHVSFTDIDTKHPKSVAPDIEDKSTVQLTGWKGETVSAQVVVWSSEATKQIEYELSEFKSDKGILDSNIAQARFVRYVMTDAFEDGCGHRKPEDYPASLSADMLDNIECMNIEAKTVRPIWVTVNIPASAIAGDYKGKLSIFSEGKKNRDLEIELTVQDKVLPPASEWNYHLDLWQHPSAVARVQNLELWSDEHFEAMKPLYKKLANAGQKVITANVNKDPWNNQCFDKYEDMIIWTKNSDGSWTYDYTIFDKWVTFMMGEIGIKKMINCYSIVPWNNELCYRDGATGEIVTVKADPGTKVFDEMWTPFLSDFVKHLKEKGWLEITNIAMDERNPKDMDIAIAMIQKAGKGLGISMADNHQSYQKYPFIKDISVGARHSKASLEEIEMRREKGLNTTYYVCCSSKFPNVFTFSAPAEATYSGWYAAAVGYDGSLRWAYNSWVENPLTDSRFRTWPAGDTYLVYPEARSSIRFERLLEGIQDVEKIRILCEEFAKDGSAEALRKLKTLNNEVAKFGTTDPSEPAHKMLNQAKQLLKELSE